MAFKTDGKPVKFPRNEHVDIHVTPCTLNSDAAEEKQVQVVEIREFIKNGEVYGHGLVLPLTAIADLQVALTRVTE